MIFEVGDEVTVGELAGFHSQYTKRKNRPIGTVTRVWESSPSFSGNYSVTVWFPDRFTWKGRRVWQGSCIFGDLQLNLHRKYKPILDTYVELFV